MGRVALPSALSIDETDEAGERRLATSSFGVKDLQAFIFPPFFRFACTYFYVQLNSPYCSSLKAC